MPAARTDLVAIPNQPRKPGDFRTLRCHILGNGALRLGHERGHVGITRTCIRYQPIKLAQHGHRIGAHLVEPRQHELCIYPCFAARRSPRGI